MTAIAEQLDFESLEHCHATRTQRDLLQAGLARMLTIRDPDVFAQAHIAHLTADIADLTDQIDKYERSRVADYLGSILPQLGVMTTDVDLPAEVREHVIKAREHLQHAKRKADESLARPRPATSASVDP